LSSLTTILLVRKSLRERRKWLASGGIVGHVYRYAITGFSARMTESAALALSLDPRVEFIEEDGEVFAGTTQSNPPSWGLDRIDQRDLPVDSSYSYTKDGTGVNVYVIDTGIRLTHQDFGGRANLGADCTVTDGGGNCVGPGTDERNHGTLVASIVGGSQYGVAKNTTLYNVRVIPLDGFAATVAMVIAGVDWVTAHHAKPAVANMSLQTASISTSLDKAVRRSIAAGVIYVVIAGNNNEDASLKSPSDVTQAIVVGATGNETSPFISDSRWVGAFNASNFGAVLDLFAPGAGITGASSTGDTASQTLSGTSLASPHVAGAAAQYLQIDPTACPCMINHILTDSPAQGGVVTTDHVGNPGSGSPNKLLFVPQTWPTPSYSSLSLNGSSAYLDVPDPPSGGVPLDITGAITVEAWIKTTSTVRQAIVERYNTSACTGTADGGYSLLIRPNGNVRFQTLKNGCELDLLDASGVNVRD
jgi:subtilisin family serine protease